MNSSVQQSHPSDGSFADGSLSFGSARGEQADENRVEAAKRAAADLSLSLVPAGPLEPHWVYVIESATD